jgi:hypothetical protein
MRTKALLAVAVLALAGASQLRPALLEQRSRELGAVAPVAPPADVAVTSVFLGAFRGLVVDYLWLRTMRLEDEGKLFEALDLSDWITKLEPRLEQVWTFRAHALAYNASVATDDPVQRWRWIQNGVSLLRDRGIPINPRAPELYFMLSRIYTDRVGEPYDDYQLQLKKSVAVELAKGFGRPGAEVSLDALAASPASESALDAEARALFSPLPSDLDAWLATPDGALAWEEAGREPAKLAARDRLEAFLRARWLREVAKIDPKLVAELDRTYGPLDWRGCDAVALYWAVLGARAARTLGPERATRDERRCERLAINAVKNALRRGRLVLEPDGSIFFAPIPKLAPRVIQLYDDAIERCRAAEARGEAWKSEEEDEAESDDGHHHELPPEARNAGAERFSLEDAEKDFFVEAIMVLAQYGHDAESRRVWSKFAARHPDLAGTSQEDFVNRTLRLEVLGGDEAGASLVTTQQLLLGTWTRAWTALAYGDDEHAIGLVALADRAYREWMRFVARKAAEGDTNAVNRLGAADLVKVKERALEDVKKRLTPLVRARLEDRAASFGAAKPEGDR